MKILLTTIAAVVLVDKAVVVLFLAQSFLPHRPKEFNRPKGLRLFSSDQLAVMPKKNVCIAEPHLKRWKARW
jgi:hypothetical protein